MSFSTERTKSSSHSKPSLPIDIPTRRSFVLDTSIMPPKRSPSPDLLFEMSPVAADFPSHAESQSTATKASAGKGYEPFLYSVFPGATSRRTQPMAITQKADTSRRIMPTRPLPNLATVSRQTRDHREHIDDDNLDPPRPCAARSDNPVTRINGFEPDLQFLPPGLPVKPHARLSPSSLWPSYSPPAPITSHGFDEEVDDPSYAGYQPSMSGQRQLLQRIDNQDYLPGKSAHRSTYGNH